jgi:hypothetical protein
VLLLFSCFFISIFVVCFHLFHMKLRSQAMRTTTDPNKPPKALADAAASFQARCVATLRAALPAELKAHGTTLPKADIDAIAASLARRLNRLADVSPDQKGKKAQMVSGQEWISTQEAANRCGFSRPFVAALLDSGAYQGKVQRTPGGHRKVLASEFEALVAKASAQAPKTLAQARKAVDLNQQNDGEVTPPKEREQSRARAQALAKKLGIAS